MSPNATLLAYSGSPNIQQLRDQAALLSQMWREQKDKLKEQDRAATASEPYSSSSSTTASTVPAGSLETLTIETAKSNIIIRAVQPRLLLVLVGGPAPRRKSDFFKVTAEAKGDARYPDEHRTPTDSKGTSFNDEAPEELLEGSHDQVMLDETVPTRCSDLSEAEKIRMLSIQRKKMDAATEFMRGDFSSRNFVMPDEGAIP